VSYVHSSSDETINLVTGQGSGIAGSYSAGDTYTNIQDVTGGAGNDTIVASAAANFLDGSGGSNTVSYAGSTSSNGTTGVTVDLSAGTGSGNYAQGDTYANIQNAIGSDYNDTLTGFATVGGPRSSPAARAPTASPPLPPTAPLPMRPTRGRATA
jgi:hypothetical protein